MKKDTPFWNDLSDFKNTISINGKPTSMALYNLYLSRRDLKLWKAGMKPHRAWKVSVVKKYFGLTGYDRAKLVEQIEALISEVKEMENQILEKKAL